MLGIPVVCSSMMWVCIYDADAVGAAGVAIRTLGAVTILGTAALAALEANVLRGTGLDRPTPLKRVGCAAFWFVAHLGAWILAYPSYLRWRRRYGAKNQLKGATVVAAGFVGSFLCGVLWPALVGGYIRELFP
jgi:hypothetical protein